MDKPFSARLENWISSKEEKNLTTLIDTFGDKSFAVIMFLFMLFPATPLPTAAHVFEVVVLIVAGQMVIGRKVLWIPKFLSKRIKLKRAVKSKIMKKIISGLKKLEAKASPYGQKLFKAPLIDRVLGLVIIVFTLAAFFSPPLSGLDTLPALGVVIISLSILLENVILLAMGVLIGSGGVVISVFLAQQVIHLLHRIF